ncbi:3'-5' RNA helicase YTHDC2 [Trichonephila clavipes]|uniref:RNA-directed DNA polymerase n=1 Tax=Trichonephila clavipes TaxID=2585209 RepID=A0A8X6WDV2_TRICX|nr:3'-5' RNA helicase YTHDC2 [Trichonephila clavipes]
MSFGLRNAPSTFQRFITEVLYGLDFVFPYLDDVLVASSTEEEHSEHLKMVFERFQQYGLRINVSKSVMGAAQVEYLGFLITAEGSRPLPEKVQAIFNYKLPETIHDLRTFLGMINFYRRYLKDAAKTQAPLHELLKGAKKKDSRKVHWTDDTRRSFEKCKTDLAEAALLSFPRSGLPLSLCTDASDFAVGAVLQQLENERWKPIAFYSKKLNETQTRYSTYDRELLGIYLSVKHFKHLLEGNDFVIYTDHKPLTFAFKQKNEKASPRQQRQHQYISEFSCNIQHVLGKDNVVADALSRIHSISEINFEEIAEEQTTDEELQILLHNNSLKFKPSTLPSGKKLWCDISTQKIRPYIPQKFRFQIFQLIHGLAHPGIKSTVKLMIEKYVWSDIKKQVREWAKACIRCQKCKVSRHTKSKLGDFEQPDERFSVVHIDLIGKLPPSEGMQYCLTCIDRFSCWMEAIPIPEITAEIVGRAFYEKWICRFGVPAKIVTDQGRQFEAELFRSIAAICGAKVAHTTSYHPQCNGKVERLHRTLKGAIKAHNNIRWTESLPTVLLGLRAAIRPDISYTIAQMVYDRLKPAYLLAVDNQNEQTSVGQKNEISNWKELSPMPDEQSTTSCGRKIKKPILSTNIAETSVTINDVVFVIDCGKVKEKSYDSLTGVTHLKAGWISKASAIQRRGRAGRCRPGLCYHLYSRARFNSFQKFQVAEILRVPIHELCLQAKLLAPPNAPIADFLAKAPDPPPFMVTRNAVTLLKTIDALDPWEELTELGLHLLDMPIEPRLGKMILYSVVLKCVDPILTIVCCLSYRDPFLIPSQPAQKRAVAMAKRKFACDTFSDHMVLLRAFQAWQKAKVEGHERIFCARNFISHATMEMVVAMRSQLLGQLRASGFIRARGNSDIRDLNTNSEIWAVIKAALCAGTYPNLIRIDRDRQQLITQKESKVRFHHSSVLNKLPVNAKHSVAALRKQMIQELPCDWLVYEEMMRTGSIAHAHCCSLITPITVSLFAGPARLPLDALHEPDQARLEGYMEEGDSEDDTKYDNQKAMFKIDDWISFRVEPEIARLALQLRQKWHALFLKRMHAPSKVLTPADECVIRTIANVLIVEDQFLNLVQPTGIGQRPRPILGEYTSPVHLRKPMPTSPSHRNPNYFNPNTSFNTSGLSCYSDEMPMMSNTVGSSSNYNPAFSSCSPQRNPMSSPFNTSSLLQMASKQEFTPPCVTNSRIRYFIIKANTSRVVEVSMAKNIWAFTSTTERKLLSAIKEGKEVILIFSIQGSGHFQGFARFTPHLSDQRPPEFSAANLGTCYQIEWIKKANIPFQSTRHLQNAWNENRKVQISRDGQELEPSVGESLCKLIVKGQPVFTSECFKSTRRPLPFIGDTSALNRGQMQWDQSPSSSWYDAGPVGQKYWSQSNT